MSIIPGILNNAILISAVTAWLIAQLLKVAVNFILLRKLNFQMIISSGGFPSSHSATVSALALGIGKYYGCDSPIFAVAAVFGMIVLYDAAGVRRAAGKQAEVLNQLIERLYHGPVPAQEKLKELIGHTPLEVFGGVMVGLIVGFLI
ncbi:divergent PAP2 family protein [Desulfosporosinus sp. BICA1-9]|uniref:divergent PAP2 family protein n=1 Tax=Desulfosporosinus sp. BICA1-9 TaxID=1531958 RepID=UPI00054C6731|nr:divergent PAP2 family protein [Desulfosporosinus sp. BICA1-9]KJS49824.1 MAG: membrane protein [Peptococcaceae bacterium BRH_c23]KJS78783.1 MAG: membrane protein [Desulfosporosinus sp. BICA1-9]HBW35535.1 divergent PAP2 family protein [Desulfosporosinus sp.]